MNLRKVIEMLRPVPAELVLSVGWNDAFSYRGIYSELAFQRAENVTAGSMLKIAEEALGTVFEGYKGGEYEMKEYTDCYLVNDYSETGEMLSADLLAMLIEKGKQDEFVKRAPRPQETGVQIWHNHLGVALEGASISSIQGRPIEFIVPDKKTAEQIVLQFKNNRFITEARTVQPYVICETCDRGGHTCKGCGGDFNHLGMLQHNSEPDCTI